MPKSAPHPNRRHYLQLAGLFVLVASSACTQTVSLGYGSGVSDPRAPAASRGRIAVAKFTDGRADGYRDNQVGRAHSAIGVPGPAIYAQQDPVIWVSDGFARALTNAGFTVERVDAASNAGDLPTVGGTVREVFVRSFLGGSGEVRSDVVIDQKGAQLLQTSCKGGKGIVVWVDPGTEFRNTLTASLDELMMDCLPKLMPVLESKATAP